MKKYLILLIGLLVNTLSAQYITLSKVVTTSDNKDRFFYKITPETTAAQYLGEVEVQGFSAGDPEVFSQIYKKAKTLGANSFSLRQTDSIDGKSTFDPAHYFISLYYTATFPKEENALYIISSSARSQKIKINNHTVTVAPRSYLKRNLNESGTLSLTTGAFLGSKITLSAKENQPAQYFQILPAGLRADHQGMGSLELKSGDIILLEKSYAQFLTAVYQEIK